MDFKTISLIWDESDCRRSPLSVDSIDDLKLKRLIDINSTVPLGRKRLDLYDFFTSDPSTIQLRNNLFFELYKYRNLLPRLKELCHMLQDFSQLSESRSSKSMESSLYVVKEIFMYLDIIDGFWNLFHNISFKSKALVSFVSAIEDIYMSDDIKRLRKEAQKLEYTINTIESITIGVNINSQLQPIEAGILSINNRKFKSGNVIDKFLSFDFTNDEYTCIAPLEPITKDGSRSDRMALTMSINNCFLSVFSKSLSSSKDIIRKYSQTKISWLYKLIPEFSFIIGCMDFQLKLIDKNYPLCNPIFSENESIQDLYDPYLAVFSEDRVVQNSITFTPNERIYILTGPNQGGKSVFLRAIGMVYAMLHLGMLLPAKTATIFLADNIFTHFPSKIEKNSNGRFASECIKLSEINKEISENSLFLFDEALSGTSSFEALAIAKELLIAYAQIGCKGIFATHIHDLCNEIKSVPNTKTPISCLSAEHTSDVLARTYKIKKGQSYGQSFALDIASQYGLDHKTILTEYRKHVNKE